MYYIFIRKFRINDINKNNHWKTVYEYVID